MTGLFLENAQIKIEERITRIRELAEGISVQTKSHNQVLEIMERMDSTVQDSSGKHDWLGTENNFGTAINASNYLCAAEILDGIPGMENKAEKLFEKGKFYLRVLNKKDTENQAISDFTPIAQGVNISNELDPNVYIPEQDVFEN